MEYVLQHEVDYFIIILFVIIVNCKFAIVSMPVWGCPIMDILIMIDSPVPC